MVPTGGVPISTAATVRGLGRPLDDPASTARALDDLLSGREPPALLGLGEPTHGIAAFPLLRNELLDHLVTRGYRSVALETDLVAAALVDDHVNGAPSDVDTVLATGFSHGFGAVPGNRELVGRLRAHNADRPPPDRVRFHGFDAPVEYAGAPGPRSTLTAAVDHLPAALRPESTRALDALLGDDEDWADPAAMLDPSASVGGSERARALRVVADDVASALRRAAPDLRATDPAGHDLALAHARTAQGLLRYHAAMARTGADRVATLLSVRAEMMAENLLAIAARERHRGPTLVFAHNAHLRPTPPTGGGAAGWANAGALVRLALGERYAFVATDANPDSAPATLQGELAAASTGRTLFPAGALRAALPLSTGTGDPIVPGHIPLRPEDLDGTDAVVFVTETDGRRHRYW